MDFTVIIPSRNRPTLLRKAIDSVLMQTHSNTEVIVVNDGSDGENESAYATLANELVGRVRFLNLEKAKNGHGQSGSINCGAEIARGQYLCFLDDDDYWTDPGHLKRAHQCLQHSNETIDIYFSNQLAFLNDTPVLGPIWLEPLEDILNTAQPDETGAYPVSIRDLMQCSGFGHLNTMIVSSALYAHIKGMDENIRYECDLDFYLRTIDASNGMRYYPGVVSRHNAPDQKKALNMSTVVSFSQKMLFRAYVWDKAFLFSQSPIIRSAAAKGKSYALKRIAQSLATEQQFKQSFYYARQALATGFNPKWLAYCSYLGFRALF